MGFNMSTFTQFVGGRLKSQDFGSSGTFTPPAGVTTVWVTMIGGGGSGGASANYDAVYGGAAGAYVIKRAINVSPGVGVAVTIGAGGAAVSTAGSGVVGNNGGATSFGGYVVSGGQGGIGNVAGGGAPGGGQVGSGYWPSGSIGGRPGGAYQSGGYLYFSGYYGGAGGLFGDGGYGSDNFVGSAGAAPANSGAGGGACRTAFYDTVYSGAGGSGRCIVEWIG